MPNKSINRKVLRQSKLGSVSRKDVAKAVREIRSTPSKKGAPQGASSHRR